MPSRPPSPPAPDLPSSDTNLAVGPGPTEPARPTLLRLAVAGMMGLTLVLWGLAFWQANPVVLSPTQFDRADELIVAHRESTESQHVVVDQVLKGGLEPGVRIRIPNLPPAQPGEAPQGLLLALNPFRRDFRITVINEGNPVPLVYPATADVISRSRSLISSTKR